MSRRISESEFTRNERLYLEDLAVRLQNFLDDFDLNCKVLGRECNLDPRIVQRVRRAIRINGECERRIIFFIERSYEQREKQC